jgi:DNA polymerase III alpha subunit
MELAKRLGGFSGGEADDLRKAISKEYRNGMAWVIKFLEDKGYKEKWLEGCLATGLTDELAAKIWQLIIAFGDYGFNKSHARSYGAQAYQDMWLKVNYPTEFYASLLTFESDLAKQVVREASIFGVDVKHPDVNRSVYGFKVHDNQILYGLNGIKNLGDVGIKEIIEGQPYNDLEDFYERVRPRAVNKTAKKSLARAGAFDCWNVREDWHPDEIDEGEREVLGVCLSQARNLMAYVELIEERITTEPEFDAAPDGEGVTIGGEIVSYRLIKTRGGKQMCFIDVQFKTNHWSCTLFPDEWIEFGDLVKDGSPVMVRGRKDIRDNGKVALIVDYMCGIEELAMAITQGDTNDN